MIHRNVLKSCILLCCGTAVAATASAAEINYRNHANFSLGAVSFASHDTSLFVSGFGSGGSDGVYILLSGSSHFAMRWDAYDVASTATGSYLQLSATGRINGVSGTPMGSSRITDQGTTLNISANYGANPFRVIVANGSTVVFDSTFASGAGASLATVPRWPGGCRKGPFPPFQPFPWCYWWDFSSPTLFTLAGGRTVTGDNIRILNNGPDVATALQSFSIVGANVPDLVVRYEFEAVPPFVPGSSPAGLVAVGLGLTALAVFVLRRSGFGQALVT